MAERTVGLTDKVIDERKKAKGESAKATRGSEKK